jgi:hypothetical protein
MSQRLEVELDDTTVSYLRQRCVRRGDLAGAAAIALRELALHHAVAKLELWHQANPDYAELADREYDEALAELS